MSRFYAGRLPKAFTNRLEEREIDVTSLIETAMETEASVNARNEVWINDTNGGRWLGPREIRELVRIIELFDPDCRGDAA